ncbi:pescadillo homolog isoform X2 [Watersipora subatra]|uniref:pescadillo homolog isoform X2 n=1 Tax=Watersipora subatra TaxID=2589382 RepID=UPI00355BB463
MGRIKRKYEAGAATAYVSRKKALRKLQLSLPDFRRLCILKGIYPHEPKHRKKVEKGSTAIKTYYFRKDIQFLLHEPIINKFRDFKVYTRKLKKAIDKKEEAKVDRIKQNKPRYKLDHIVKERYPSFIDAVRDLDDCLCLVFLFGTLPRQHATKSEAIQKCRRLSVEFLHYLIAAKALRKVFVSIKGIYYQAEIMGQTVTWVVPHSRGFQRPSDVDFKVMSVFIEFYLTLLGFINFKLFSSLNITYPPKLELPPDTFNSFRDMAKEDIVEETLASMTQSLAHGLEVVDQPDMDEFPAAEDGESGISEEVRKEQQAIKCLVKLFDGKKFYLGRETPRESLTFILRCFGAKVSWDPTVCAGASYPETDETITHQIVDRSQQPPTKYMNRYYIQPQWVYDSINSRQLLDVKDYLVGALLPPHLSPFVEEGEGDYVPPERVRLLQRVAEEGGEQVEESMNNDDDNDDMLEASSEDEDASPRHSSEVSKPKGITKRPTMETMNPEPPMKQLGVKAGVQEVVNEEKIKQKETSEQKRLAEMMIPKKNKRLYNKIMYSKKKKSQEVNALAEKRKAIDIARKTKKKGPAS